MYVILLVIMLVGLIVLLEKSAVSIRFLPKVQKRLEFSFS